MSQGESIQRKEGKVFTKYTQRKAAAAKMVDEEQLERC